MNASILTRRLTSDYQKVLDLVASSGGTVEMVSARGNPPNDYTVVYHCRGLTNLSGSMPVYGEHHKVRLQLTANYPREKPVVTMLTPMFHPHVFTNLTVCIGTWIINESLDNLLLRLGAIIQYHPDYFNFSSPANPLAANWAKLNLGLFPLGQCNFKGLPGNGGVQWTNL